MNILDYANQAINLFPTQKFVLKAIGGIPLSEKNKIEFTDFRSGKARSFTEPEYLRYLFDEGRASSPELPSRLSSMTLVVGRRSGKTVLAAAMLAHAIHRLLSMESPQKRYGLPAACRIHVTGMATCKDQARILYDEVTNFVKADQISRDSVASTLTRRIDFRPKGCEQSTIRFVAKCHDAKGLRGTTNFAVAMDEMAHFQGEGQEAVHAVTPSLGSFAPKSPTNPWESIGPMDSSSLYASTPGRKDTFFHKEFLWPFNRDLAQNTLALRVPSWEMNPSLPRAFLEASLQRDPVGFANEYEAEFLAAD